MKRAPISRISDVLALASQDGRVCPKPAAWNRLYELLPDRRRDGYGFIPPAPLILDGWHDSSDEQKRDRFIEHLQWAHTHNALAKVHHFLLRLPESEWHHVGE
jgi:hypothetical protein